MALLCPQDRSPLRPFWNCGDRWPGIPEGWDNSAEVLQGKCPPAISSVVVVAVTAGIATAATLYEGYPTAEVNLNDGGVWVTRSVDAMVGHLNYPSRTLDGAVHTHGADFSLFQDGTTSTRASVCWSCSTPATSSRGWTWGIRCTPRTRPSRRSPSSRGCPEATIKPGRSTPRSPCPTRGVLSMWRATTPTATTAPR